MFTTRATSHTHLKMTPIKDINLFLKTFNIYKVITTDDISFKYGQNTIVYTNTEKTQTLPNEPGLCVMVSTCCSDPSDKLTPPHFYNSRV